MAKTIALSIGSEISACLVMAASRVSPIARKALTIAPVPMPDVPPKTKAAIGAETTPARTPVTNPATGAR